jgi:FemAB-related protein (PEP-CTERM system-associated)
MTIHLYTDADRDNWESFVENHPNATFYHRIGWKEVMEKSFGHKTYYLLAEREGQIAGILPIVHVKSLLFGSIMCSMPFLNFGGICADDEEAEKTLLDRASEIAREHQADYLELRHSHQSKKEIPRKTHKVSMTIELNADPEVLWKNFSTKHRTSIRRAAKNELEVLHGKEDLLPAFFRILTEGWKELGTPLYSHSFFENILSTFHDSIEIFLVLHKGKPVAGALNGLFRETVEGMWAASPRQYVKLQANYCLYWEMIRKACLDGFKWYHLGRSSTDSGGSFYKEKWNAFPKQLYWEYVLNKKKNIPELNVNNPKYKLAIQTWRKLPLALTSKLGPRLAKAIP